MGLLFGFPEAVIIPAPSVTNEYSKPMNENSAGRSYSKSKGSFDEYEQLLQPVIQHNRAPKHTVEDLPSMWLEDIKRASESESDSFLQKDNRESAKDKKRSSKKRGKTRGRDQNLQYFDGKRWVPAVYHHKIRGFLIEEASQNGQYTYPRERGPDPYDETSYLESQKNWGPVRDKNWAEILYVFQKGKHQKDPTYTLSNWKFHGKIVIAGYDKLPMLRFKDMPDTLSSVLHGRDMEAMKRTDPRITQRDFMARMPLRHTTHAGSRMNVQTPSSIGMRMTRFRQQQGMLSWVGRDGSQTIQNSLWERLPRANQEANSIRGLVPPTEAEQREIRKGNEGKFLNRAGKRALTSAERVKRQEIEERRLRKRLQEELESSRGGVMDEGTRRGCKRKANDLGVDGLVEPDAKKSRHHAGHDRPKNRSMRPHSTINAPPPIDTYQPQQDYNPWANPPVQGDDRANSPAPIEGFDNGNPFQSDHHSSRRGGVGTFDYSNLPAPQTGFNYPNSSPMNYPSPNSYNNNFGFAGPLGQDSTRLPYYLRPPPVSDDRRLR